MSVVVPARNPGAGLAALLDALEHQTLAHESFEVLLIDDGSTDGSFDDIAPRGWLRVFHQTAANSYVARNLGCSRAQADLIAFTDADCRPDVHWLEAGVRAAAEADVVAGRIQMPPPLDATVWTYVEADDWRDQELALSRNAAETANLFVARSWIERVGGFDGSLPSGGDHDFVQRVIASGARAVYSEASVVFHDPKPSAVSFLATVWRRHRAAGYRAGRNYPLTAGATASRRGHTGLGWSLGRLVFSYTPVAAALRRRRDRRPWLPAPESHAHIDLTLPRKAGAVLLLYWLLPWLSTSASLWGRLQAYRDRRVACRRQD